MRAGGSLDLEFCKWNQLNYREVECLARDHTAVKSKKGLWTLFISLNNKLNASAKEVSSAFRKHQYLC
jgi:hypothetical protein